MLALALQNFRHTKRLLYFPLPALIMLPSKRTRDRHTFSADKKPLPVMDPWCDSVRASGDTQHSYPEYRALRPSSREIFTKASVMPRYRSCENVWSIFWPWIWRRVLVVSMGKVPGMWIYIVLFTKIWWEIRCCLTPLSPRPVAGWRAGRGRRRHLLHLFTKFRRDRCNSAVNKRPPVLYFRHGAAPVDVRFRIELRPPLERIHRGPFVAIPRNKSDNGSRSLLHPDREILLML